MGSERESANLAFFTILYSKGLVPEPKLQAALERATIHDVPLETVLVESGALSPSDCVEALGQRAKMGRKCVSKTCGATTYVLPDQDASKVPCEACGGPLEQPRAQPRRAAAEGEARRSRLERLRERRASGRVEGGAEAAAASAGVPAALEQRLAALEAKLDPARLDQKVLELVERRLAQEDLQGFLQEVTDQATQRALAALPEQAPAPAPDALASEVLARVEEQVGGKLDPAALSEQVADGALRALAERGDLGELAGRLAEQALLVVQSRTEQLAGDPDAIAARASAEALAAVRAELPKLAHGGNGAGEGESGLGTRLETLEQAVQDLFDQWNELDPASRGGGGAGEAALEEVRRALEEAAGRAEERVAASAEAAVARLDLAPLVERVSEHAATALDLEALREELVGGARERLAGDLQARVADKLREELAEALRERLGDELLVRVRAELPDPEQLASDAADAAREAAAAAVSAAREEAAAALEQAVGALKTELAPPPAPDAELLAEAAAEQVIEAVEARLEEVDGKLNVLARAASPATIAQHAAAGLAERFEALEVQLSARPSGPSPEELAEGLAGQLSAAAAQARDEAVAALEPRLAALEPKLSELEDALAVLRREVPSGAAVAEQAHEAALTALGPRLDALEGHLASLPAAPGAEAVAEQAREAALAALEPRLSALETAGGAPDGEALAAGAREAAAALVAERLEALEPRLSALEQALSSRVEAVVDERLGALESRLVGLEQAVALAQTAPAAAAGPPPEELIEAATARALAAVEERLERVAAPPADVEAIARAAAEAVFEERGGAASPGVAKGATGVFDKKFVALAREVKNLKAAVDANSGGGGGGGGGSVDLDVLVASLQFRTVLAKEVQGQLAAGAVPGVAAAPAAGVGGAVPSGAGDVVALVASAEFKQALDAKVNQILSYIKGELIPKEVKKAVGG